MNEPPRGRRRRSRNLAEEVGVKESRRVKARRQRDRGVWFGLGMFGLVGWSVAVPTVVGTAVGVWIDNRWPSQVSWTLTLLILGVVVGCANAWWWIQRESRDND